MPIKPIKSLTPGRIYLEKDPDRSTNVRNEKIEP
jgi:hypothetical protein